MTYPDVNGWAADRYAHEVDDDVAQELWREDNLDQARYRFVRDNDDLIRELLTDMIESDMSWGLLHSALCNLMDLDAIGDMYRKQFQDKMVEWIDNAFEREINQVLDVMEEEARDDY